MDGPAKPDIAAEIAGALEWWRDAGVDCDFTDDPADWLAKAAEPEPESTGPQPAAPPAVSVPPRALIGGPPEAWPRDLAAFQAWWLTEPSLDHGDLARRIPPRGTVGAELMILVADPEEGVPEILGASPQGKLLAGIIAALGLDDAKVYVASALPRPTPMPDWRQLAADGLGEVVAHHVALAAPKRLLVFGNGVSSLLGHDPANKPASSLGFNHDGRSLPLLAAMDLAALLARPRAKAGLWQRLLDWTGTTEK
ncbi:MAG: hypothetical protein JWQ16_3162 [Novosphingobium sp.]|nr:hypothetical protein [Novosphingobium sp.]